MGTVKIALVVAVATALFFASIGEMALAYIFSSVLFVMTIAVSLIASSIIRYQHGKRRSLLAGMTSRRSRGAYYYYDWDAK
ncbi:MAG: hypothetical protein L6Q71_04365 [Planctomycetes bacterium]|nr:hypothetical protein [Planctomycetota bacterium]NUQ33706.1 hypothetical protein [Planctomycetaceae bacterium]